MLVKYGKATSYGGAIDGLTGPSPKIWADCPVSTLLQDPSRGRYFWDDFHSCSNLPTAVSERYNVFDDNGTAVDQTVAIATAGTKGMISLVCDGTDEDEINISTGAIANIITAAQTPLWFEARLSVSTVVNNVCSLFVGLSYNAAAATHGAADSLITATGEMQTTAPHIGFSKVGADGDALRTVYGASGQTYQDVNADVIDPIVAAQFYRLGFKLDPEAPASKRIAFFVDGVESSSYITQANMEAATFPDGEAMAISLLSRTTTAVAYTINLDWWRFAQLN